MSRRKKRKDRVVKPVIAIVCEDSAGVATYVKDMLRRSRSDEVAFKVIGLGRGPKDLNDMSLGLLKGSIRNQPKADAVFIIVDFEDSNHYRRLIETFHDNRRSLVFASKLCFETFFLLHFSNSTAPYLDQDELLQELRQFPGFENYNKSKNSVPTGQLAGLFERAVDNAERIRISRRGDRSKNPQTDMDIFFEVVSLVKVNGVESLDSLDQQLLSRFLSNDGF